MSVQYFCDKCGAGISEHGGFTVAPAYRLFYYFVPANHRGDYKPPMEKMDLCLSCRTAIEEAIKEERGKQMMISFGVDVGSRE